MGSSTFPYKSSPSGCCRKCGKPLSWRSEPVVSRECMTGCMMQAENHIHELQKNVAANTRYCSECSSKIRHDILVNIILFPFNAVKAIVKLFHS